MAGDESRRLTLAREDDTFSSVAAYAADAWNLSAVLFERASQRCCIEHYITQGDSRQRACSASPRLASSIDKTHLALLERSATTAVLQLLSGINAFVTSHSLRDRASRQIIRAEEFVLLSGMVLVRPAWEVAVAAEPEIGSRGRLRFRLLRGTGGLAFVVEPLAARLADCEEASERARASEQESESEEASVRARREGRNAITQISIKRRRRERDQEE